MLPLPRFLNPLSPHHKPTLHRSFSCYFVSIRPKVLGAYHNKLIPQQRRWATTPPTPPSQGFKQINTDLSNRPSNWNIPNAITIARIILTPVIGYCIATQSFSLGISLLTVAALSDALDGYIARTYNLQTPLGSVLDPAADKFLMTVLTISLASAGSLPTTLAALIVGRDIFLGIRSLYLRYETLDPPVLSL